MSKEIQQQENVTVILTLDQVRSITKAMRYRLSRVKEQRADYKVDNWSNHAYHRYVCNEGEILEVFDDAVANFATKKKA